MILFKKKISEVRKQKFLSIATVECYFIVFLFKRHLAITNNLKACRDRKEEKKSPGIKQARESHCWCERVLSSRLISASMLFYGGEHIKQVQFCFLMFITCNNNSDIDVDVIVEHDWLRTSRALVFYRLAWPSAQPCEGGAVIVSVYRCLVIFSVSHTRRF